MDKKEIDKIGNRVVQLCQQKKFSQAKGLWQKLKAGGQYYKFVLPDFAFHNLKATERDVTLALPYILDTINKKAIVIHGMMAHVGKKKRRRHRKKRRKHKK